MTRKRNNIILDMNVIKPGDVIGFSGCGWVSAAVNIGTYGLPFFGISHVGVMAKDEEGRLLLFESTSLQNLPCVFSGENFVGTQAHVLGDVLEVYSGRIYHYPLYRPLYRNEDTRLTRFLMETIHTPYDLMGAFRATGVGISWIESLFREQDLSAIFCSEWIASAFSMVGIFPTSNASRWNPNRFVRHLRWNDVLFKPRRLK